MIKNIAFPTDDGQTIHAHLGQAKYFKIFRVENSTVLTQELREKPSHSHGDHSHEEGAPHPGQVMFEALRDCQVLISGGMGAPAYERAKSMGLETYLTGEKLIDQALQTYLDGTLSTDMRRVHLH